MFKSNVTLRLHHILADWDGTSGVESTSTWYNGTSNHLQKIFIFEKKNFEPQNPKKKYFSKIPKIFFSFIHNVQN